ncbi:hypothetical protein ACQEVF_58640 [Nonomuraea polychroma]|uniref:hypothetical protein n=1 Tax=Nonomuraea polychroma TaxID=46176 RepID=UPI003D8CBE42
MARLRPLPALDPDLEPWERQPGETSIQYGHFTTFRDLGRARRLAQVAEQTGLNPAHIRALSAARKWFERVDAWDRHLDEQYQIAWVERRRRAADDDARILNAMIGIIGQALPRINPAIMTAGEVARWIDIAMRQRRILFGDPTEHITVSGGDTPVQVELADFMNMDPHARQVRLAELAAQVQLRLAAARGDEDDDEHNDDHDGGGEIDGVHPEDGCEVDSSGPAHGGDEGDDDGPDRLR